MLEVPRESAVTMYGTAWCGDCHRSRRCLDRNGVAYRYVDIEDREELAKLVEQLNGGLRRLPTIVFSDGTVLVEPSDRLLEEKIAAFR
jgi:mycoredoxin